MNGCLVLIIGCLIVVTGTAVWPLGWVLIVLAMTGPDELVRATTQDGRTMSIGGRK